jgi:hypothetical protein
MLFNYISRTPWSWKNIFEQMKHLFITFINCWKWSLYFWNKMQMYIWRKFIRNLKLASEELWSKKLLFPFLLIIKLILKTINIIENRISAELCDRFELIEFSNAEIFKLLFISLMKKNKFLTILQKLFTFLTEIFFSRQSSLQFSDNSRNSLKFHFNKIFHNKSEN